MGVAAWYYVIRRVALEILYTVYAVTLYWKGVLQRGFPPCTPSPVEVATWLPRSEKRGSQNRAKACSSVSSQGMLSRTGVSFVSIQHRVSGCMTGREPQPASMDRHPQLLVAPVVKDLPRTIFVLPQVQRQL